MTRRPSRRLAALVVTGALGLTACGGADDGNAIADAAPAGAAVDGAAPAAGISPLPAVEVIDLATASPTPLDELLPADQPLLLWFWAPW